MDNMEYRDFKKMLDGRLNQTTTEMLINIIKQPQRYVGLFRTSNIKTKLVQNITQSREIKFGDFMEDLLERYLLVEGYKVHDNKTVSIKISGKMKKLNMDQLFEDESSLYLIEQKIRDDHDSTKKVGQFNNFLKKIEALKTTLQNKELIAIMWFIDDQVSKNKHYYNERMKEVDELDVDGKIFYGGELFNFLTFRNDVWGNIIENLTRLRQEDDKEIISIPDFETSLEILDALVEIPKSNWDKLNSNEPIYVNLRNELFGQSNILLEARKIRNAR